MSSTEETSELKGGHPPAVKVGGMRVVQHKPPKSDEDQAEAATSQEETSDETQVANRNKNDALYMSGVETKGNKDFPPEAVKHYHQNPVPELQKHELGMKQTSHRPFQPQPRGHNN